MATRRLDVNLHLDRSEYAKSEKAARAESKATAAAMISDADAAAKAQVEFVKRANAQKIAELARAKKTEVELAKEAEAAKAAAERKAAADTDRLRDQELAAEKARKAEEIATARNAIAQRKSALANLHREAIAQQDAQAAASDRTANSILGAAKQALFFGASMMGLQGAQAIFAVLTEHAEKFRKYLFDSAEKVADLRNAMRELAALRGDMGVSGPTTAHVLATAAQTLQTPGEVNKMEQSYLGTAELGIGRTISKEDADKFLVSIGKQQSMEGGEAGAYGALAGQLILLSDKKKSAEEYQAQFSRMFAIQQPGGFTTFTQSAEQFAKVAPLVKSGVLSPEEAMATLSAFSTSSPGESATMTEQFTRATMAGRLKGKGMAINPELDFEKSYEYMKSIGADKETNPIEIGKKIADDFAAQAAKAKKSGGKFDQYSYLLQHGFGNDQDRQAIMLMAGMRNSGDMAKIEAAANAPLQIGAPGQGTIDQRFGQRLAADPLLQRKQGERFAELNQAKAGLEQEPIELWQRSAFNQLVAEGKQFGTYEEWKTKANSYTRYGTDAALYGTGQADATIGRVDSRVMANMMKEMAALGVERPGLGDVMLGSTSNETWARKARELQAAGADPNAGNTEAMKNLAEAIKKNTEATERASAAARPAVKGPPAPIPGKAPPIPGRPP